jgi:DNA-binding response OmpR family regulator
MGERERILVVDDELGIRECLDVLLGDEYEVRQAADASEALRAVAAAAPRLVFLDVRLGGDSGLDVLRLIAASGHRVPVVMLTASVDERIERESRALGAVGFIKKPFDIAEVEAITRASPCIR